MGSNKTSGKKKRLSRAGKQTRWAPFWLIPRIFGRTKGVHPSRITRVKRRWKKTKLRV